MKNKKICSGCGASFIPENNRNNLKLTFTKSVPQVAPGSQWDVVATTETLDGTITYDTKNGNFEFFITVPLLNEVRNEQDLH